MSRRFQFTDTKSFFTVAEFLLSFLFVPLGVNEIPLRGDSSSPGAHSMSASCACVNSGRRAAIWSKVAHESGIAHHHGDMRSAAVPLLNFPLACIGVFAVPVALTYIFGKSAASPGVFLAAVTLFLASCAVFSSLLPQFCGRSRRSSPKWVLFLAGIVLTLSPVVRAQTPVLSPAQTGVLRLYLNFTLKATLILLIPVIAFTGIEHASLVVCSSDWSAEPLHMHPVDPISPCSPFGQNGVSLAQSIWFTAYEFQIIASMAIATVGVSVIAWNLAFVRLLVEAQAAEHSHTNAMLRWLSHECRSPVAAALLTLESVFQDNLPGVIASIHANHSGGEDARVHTSMNTCVSPGSTTRNKKNLEHCLVGTNPKLLDAVVQLPKSPQSGFRTRSVVSRTVAQPGGMTGLEPTRRLTTSSVVRPSPMMLGGFRSERSLSQPGRSLQTRLRVALLNRAPSSDRASGKYWLSTGSADSMGTFDNVHSQQEVDHKLSLCSSSDH